MARIGEIQRVVWYFGCLHLRHNLSTKFPFCEVAAFDCCVEIVLVTFSILADKCFSFSICQILDTLHAFHVELYPVMFVISVDEAKRMAAETVMTMVI